MYSFLNRIAQVYYENFGNKLSDFTFVFPNRRAGLFFQKSISEISRQAIFSPEIITINDCILSASDLHQIDKTEQLFRLFHLYKSCLTNHDSFDSFVYWGQILLSDFDEIDKYLIDPKNIFTYIENTIEIKQVFSHFSEQQIEAIQECWSNFSVKSEDTSKEKFINTWNILFDLYTLFRNELLMEKKATEGMIYREVAEKLLSGNEIPQWKNKKFVFIGFNALNTSEKTLFSELKKLDIADFYWDYEAPEVRDLDNSASMFYLENTQNFPSRFQINNNSSEALQTKNFEQITVPSTVGQLKQVHSILNKIQNRVENKEQWIQTAVVLPDESLILPLLNSVPESIEKINVTMGFPIKMTPIVSLIEYIFELRKHAKTFNNQTSFYHQTVKNILNHQYIASICRNEISEITNEIIFKNLVYVDHSFLSKNKVLSSIFDINVDDNNFLLYLLNILKNLQYHITNSNNESNQQIDEDFIYKYYQTINRLNDIIQKNSAKLEVNNNTLRQLLKELINNISIPFVGEPLNGLQIMGVLETRGLDFENVLITSFNEGIYPSKRTQQSFIPHNIRWAFGLTTFEHHDAVTAYNFYRLIHRAKNIYFISDSRNDVGKTAETSRFLHQLKLHYGISVKQKFISYEFASNDSKALKVEKNASILNKLERFFLEDEKRKSLSPSSINTYIDCPLQFYFKYIEQISPSNEIKETIEADVFGTLFHASIENIYSSFIGKTIDKQTIESLIKDKQLIRKAINMAFAENYFKKNKLSTVNLEGNNLLISRILEKYITQLIKLDAEQAPFKYINSEVEYSTLYPIFNGNKKVKIKGVIDRLDEVNGNTRIIDYKTGSYYKKNLTSIDELFNNALEKRQKYIFQLYLYAILQNEKAEKKGIPSIVFIRKLFEEDFFLQLQDFETNEEEFRNHLTNCLENIFDPEIPFTQTDNQKNCIYCNYRHICNITDSQN